MPPSPRAAHQTAAEYGAYDKQLAKAVAEESTQAYRRDRNLITLDCALATISAIAMGWFLSNAVTGPLNRAVDMAEAVASGDLRSDIVAGSQDETGNLLATLGRMTGNLSNMVGSVRGCADGISTASHQIASGNQDLSSRTDSKPAPFRRQLHRSTR